MHASSIAACDINVISRANYHSLGVGTPTLLETPSLMQVGGVVAAGAGTDGAS
ncbi:hypothetical protein ACIBCO_31950 [Streptomyces violascens]|uniref:hypothetical protein n=1 Tax=Streptomyces violascens TaxID=67381 RepID=UPI0037933F0D